MKEEVFEEGHPFEVVVIPFNQPDTFEVLGSHLIVDTSKLLKGIFEEHELITKKVDNIVWRIDNCLYDGKEVLGAWIDFKDSKLVLNTSAEDYSSLPTCPRCGHKYYGQSFVSKKDNKEICSSCNTKEDLLDEVL